MKDRYMGTVNCRPRYIPRCRATSRANTSCPDVLTDSYPSHPFVHPKQPTPLPTSPCKLTGRKFLGSFATHQYLELLSSPTLALPHNLALRLLSPRRKHPLKRTGRHARDSRRPPRVANSSQRHERPRGEERESVRDPFLQPGPNLRFSSFTLAAPGRARS